MASHRGRKFDTWKFEVDKIPITIVVKMRTMTSTAYGDENDNRSTTEFFVENADYDIYEKDEDVNALKERVFKELEKQIKDSIAWEQFWYVTFKGLDRDVDPEDTWEPQKFGVDTDFECLLIEIGTKPDGGKLYRNVLPEGRAKRSTAGSKEGMPEVGFSTKTYYGESNKLRALVPANEESTAALRRLFEGFKSLHEQLYKLLEPKVIEKNLARMAAPMLGFQKGCG